MASNPRRRLAEVPKGKVAANADPAEYARGVVRAEAAAIEQLCSRIDGDFSEEAVSAAADGLGASLDPPSDVHGSAEYRRHLAEVSAVRAVLQAAERRKT